MLSGSNEYISIYLSDEVLKIAQVKPGPSPKVSHVVFKDVKGIEEADLPKTIQLALQGFSVKSSMVVSVVPANMITTKNIEIPSINPEEIKSIVNLQAGRHTPFSREEIQIGYVHIGTYKTNYTKVLLVIANRNVIKKQLGVFEKAGLAVKKVLFAPEGVAAFYSKALNLKEYPKPVGIIDIGKHSTDFTFAFKGTAIAHRSIPVGKDLLIAEKDSASQMLLDEFGKTVESFQGEDIDQLPENYILTTDDNFTKELQPLIKDKLKSEVKISSYLDSVTAAQPVLVGVSKDYEDISFVDVISAGSLGSELTVNLIPEEVQMQKSIEDQAKETFKTATLSFLIFFLVACMFGMKMYFRNSFLNKLKNNYAQNRKEVTTLENRSLKTKIIQDFMTGRMVSLDTVNELYNNLPDEIYLTGIALDTEGNVSIQGISDIASTVFAWNTKLKESKMFDSVNIKSTTAKKDRGKDVSSFEITLKLKNAPVSSNTVQAKKAGE